ncbi:MAG TPA: hypothetical protein PK167_04335, partial [Prolixibacteraceae bacterium]|nr:hypothetical protein [Prolixibacteraceae bacterium]
LYRFGSPQKNGCIATAQNFQPKSREKGINPTQGRFVKIFLKTFIRKRSIFVLNKRTNIYI